MAEEKTNKNEEELTEGAEAVEVPEKFKSIVEAVEGMSVLDLSELVKVLEKKFGVTAQAAPVIMGTPVAEGASGDDASAAKSVELTSAGDQKIQVIKALREALGLGLKDAKDMSDGAPVIVKEGIPSEEAEELKGKLEGAGATVTLK